MKKKNNSIEDWIKAAFEQAGERAEAMKVVVERIQEVLDDKSDDLLNAWFEISDKSAVEEIVTRATDDETFAAGIENLLKMGVIGGYLSALEDMKHDRLTLGNDNNS